MKLSLHFAHFRILYIQLINLYGDRRNLMGNPAGSGATRTLETLGQNRDALLKRLTEGLQADPRVEAAWLTGSFGKGESDEWSDLDLNVVVTDESFNLLAENPQELFDLGGKQLPFESPSVAFPSFTM